MSNDIIFDPGNQGAMAIKKKQTNRAFFYAHKGLFPVVGPQRKDGVDTVNIPVM